MSVRALLRHTHADLRTNRGQALFSVLGTAGIIASLLLAAALFSSATNPWERIFTETRGAHVWLSTSPSADTAQLAQLEGVAEVSGPFRSVRTTAESRGVRAAVEIRAAASEKPEVSRPRLTGGRWLDPDQPAGVVLDKSVAEALYVRPGDRLRLPEGTPGARELVVLGVAETAEPHYRPGEQPGVGWVLAGTDAAAAVRAPADGSGGSAANASGGPSESERASAARSDASDQAGADAASEQRRQPGQTIGLRLSDPADTDFLVQRAVTELGADQVTGVTKWEEARADAEGGYRLLGLLFGVFGAGALLAGALVASGAISTRVRGQLRDISLLKAIGFTPAQVIATFVLQHLSMALLAVAMGTSGTVLFGPYLPGRVGAAVAVWPELPGHAALLLGLPTVALLVIAVATGLAAWRAGRAPAVPVARAALPVARPMTRLTRGVLGSAYSSPLLLGWRGAFPHRARALTAIGRLAVPLVLITLVLSVWSTTERFREQPEEVGLPAALTARGTPYGEADGDRTRRLLAGHPDVRAVLPAAETDALVPGQTGTITLRGLGTERQPYPFAMAEGRAPRGPDEAVAGAGLLRLLRAEVGDWVRMTVGGRPQVLHIVGRSLEPTESGRVISTSLDTLRERDPDLRAGYSLLVLRPDSDPREVSAELGARVDQDLEIAEVRNPAEELLPARPGLVGLVAVFALVGLTELLTIIGVCVRDRGRDLLALRAIGLTPRQISGVIVASTGFITLAAVLTGIGGGLLLSSWLIDTQGAVSGIGAGIAQLPSGWALVALGGAAVSGALAASLLPAVRITRRRLADSLSETL
ncbi:ABC transporter permease [Streptomyces oceani]|uniref:Peptide ABC transporter permease n=1 Tax=Streptomyces oceani TaxID=1075402 RepID=A0A1E7KGL7_9ACTN|nr:FtsX-like permease family protein [Streptomyces oceani]OEV03023.1 peptide ABC transporter permease [Streptomyces oceani]